MSIACMPSKITLLTRDPSSETDISRSSKTFEAAVEALSRGIPVLLHRESGSLAIFFLERARRVVMEGGGRFSAPE
jgi:hypothetical protein